MTNKCTINGCELARSAKGYCHAHYIRNLRGSDNMNVPIAHYRAPYAKDAICKVSKCSKAPLAQGLCNNHYGVLNHHGYDPTEPFTCYICGKYWDTWPIGKFVSIDHVDPLVNGGNNDNDNRRTVCYHCNLMKSEYTLSELIVRCERITLYHSAR